MRIIYIANARIPTEKAHGLQIMKMCEQFSDLGHDVELVAPKRKNKLEQDPFEFYGTNRNFKIKKVFSLDLLPYEKFLGKLAFYVQNISFAKRAAVYCLFKKADIIFTRDIVSALILSFLGKKICFEVHDSVPVNFWTKRFLKNIAQFVSTNNYKKQELIENFSINSDKILVAPNGVGWEKFQITNSKLEIRKRLGLPENKKIVFYVGNDYVWKGVEILKQAAEYLDKNILIKIISSRPYNEIPYWLKAADALILPNSRKASEMQANATSPIKLFEYMASGTPIVASDIPAIREIVSEREVCFVEPDNSQALAEGIKKVLNNPEKAQKIAEHTKELAKEYTWQKRAEKIIDFLNKKSICYFGCYDPNYARNKVLIKGLKKNRCNVIECRTEYKTGIKKYIDLFKKFKNCKNCGAVLVAHPGHDLVLFACLLTNKKIIFDPIYSYYDSFVDDRKLCRKGSLKAYYYKFLDWFCSWLPDYVLLECQTLTDYFIENYKLPKKKFIKVMMSADDEALFPREKQEKSEKFVVHFHGTFIPFQGIEHIIKAAKLLEDEKDIVFNIIGSGQTSKDIGQLIEELGVKNINYWGKRIPHEEIIEYIQESDICLGFFGLGARAQKVMTNKVFESIAMKKPIITADLPVMREIYTENEIMFCKGENPEDLAEKILYLKNNPDLRCRLAENGYNLFRKSLNPQMVTKEVISIL